MGGIKQHNSVYLVSVSTRVYPCDAHAVDVLCILCMIVKTNTVRKFSIIILPVLWSYWVVNHLTLESVPIIIVTFSVCCELRETQITSNYMWFEINLSLHKCYCSSERSNQPLLCKEPCHNVCCLTTKNYQPNKRKQIWLQGAVIKPIIHHAVYQSQYIVCSRTDWKHVSKQEGIHIWSVHI